jgi:TonB family protein
MTIDPRGRVADARLVTSSGHDLLDDAALAAARDHRFRPPGTWRRARRTFTYRLD